MQTRSGPLAGVRVLEFAGIGPGPFCGMLLSDMGCDVVRIDRSEAAGRRDVAPMNRGRRSIALDLKSERGRGVARALARRADALIEGFRPGVMERLGLGPEVLLADNPRLVYGRMTGWGQTGPLAQAAGHDINYVALTGALRAMGRPDSPPAPPLNLVGDFGGGALYLALGICAALHHAGRTGEGQVIDCAMTDGSASLTAMFHGMRHLGLWTEDRDANLLDGGAPFYDCYECADGEYIAIGSIEPQFYQLLLETVGLAGDPEFSAQMDRGRWPQLSARLEALFRTRTRAEWCAVMEGTDICFAPVLSFAEAPQHPHNASRETFVTVGDVLQPNVAPRFLGTPSRVQGPPPEVGADAAEILADWGVEASATAT